MAYLFNGSTSFLYFNDFTQMNSGSWTIGAWVRASSILSGAIVFTAATSGNFNRQTLNLNSASGEWRALQAGTTAAVAVAATSSNAVHVADEWQLIIATFSILDSKCRLYVGDLSTPVAECNDYASQTTLVSRQISGTEGYVGNGASPSEQRWTGLLSSVFVDPHEWTVAEMEYLRHTNIPRFTDNGSGATAMRLWTPLLNDANEHVRGLVPFTATDLAQSTEPPLQSLKPRRHRRSLAA